MLASLTALAFDPLGDVLLDVLPLSATPAARRRVSRTATLDGGAVITDQGYSAGDLSFELQITGLTVAQELAIRHLVTYHAGIVLSVPAGCFRGTISSADLGRNPPSVTFLVVEQVG